jgi:hypothetical protein
LEENCFLADLDWGFDLAEYPAVWLPIENLPVRWILEFAVPSNGRLWSIPPLL